MKYKKCNDVRAVDKWCFASVDGKCMLLSTTYNKNELCPFYKAIDGMMREHNELLDSYLEDKEKEVEMDGDKS